MEKKRHFCSLTNFAFSFSSAQKLLKHENSCYTEVQSAIQILQGIAGFLPALASIWKEEKRNLVTRNHIKVEILSLNTLGSSHGSLTLLHSELWKGKLRVLPLCFFSYFIIIWVLASSPNYPQLQGLSERESFAKLMPGSKEPSKTKRELFCVWSG